MNLMHISQLAFLLNILLSYNNVGECYPSTEEVLEYLTGQSVPDHRGMVVKGPMKTRFALLETVIGNIDGTEGYYEIHNDSATVNLFSTGGHITGYLSVNISVDHWDEGYMSIKVHGNYTLELFDTVMKLKIRIPKINGKNELHIEKCEGSYGQSRLTIDPDGVDSIYHLTKLETWINRALKDTLHQLYCDTMIQEAKKGSELSSVVSGIASNALLQAIIAGQNIRGK